MATLIFSGIIKKMQSLQGADVRGKKVLVRVGFDVPLDDKRRLGPGADWRIRQSLETLRFLLSQRARIILLTHLGRPGGQKKPFLRVDPVAQHLSFLLKKPVKKLDHCLGGLIQKEVQDLKQGEILFLENLRFYPGEEKADQDFAQQLARLGEIYVNEAFSACHRPHASIVLLPHLLPSYAGFSLIKEIRVLRRLREKPLSPLVVLIGGAKVQTKISFLKHFLQKAEALCLGGVIANTILQAKGIALGRTRVELKVLPVIKDLDLASPKLYLPVDAMVCRDFKGRSPVRVAAVENLKKDEAILDIGPETIQLFSDIIKKGGTIIWNGPLGRTEVKVFTQGTRELVKTIQKAQALSIVGGGDTVSFLAQEKLLNGFTHISTGGGAMLEFLVKGTLPGIQALG